MAVPDGEKPAPVGDGDVEIGMGVSGRGGDRLQRRYIGSGQDDPESVQPLEVERIGDDRADDGGGDRYRCAELAVALAGPPESATEPAGHPLAPVVGWMCTAPRTIGDRRWGVGCVSTCPTGARVRTCATAAGVSSLQSAAASMRSPASTLARTDDRRGGG
jgi:hypothetical protein